MRLRLKSSWLALAVAGATIACTDGGSGGGGFPPLTISSVLPDSAEVGATVTITGTGFEADPADMEVSFFDHVPAAIESLSATEIVVTVPAGAVTGPIAVTNVHTVVTVTTPDDFTVVVGGAWTERDYGSTFRLHGVASSGTTFVAAGSGNTIVSSDDGVVWTPRAAPDGNSYELSSVIWDGAQFVLVGDVVVGAPPGTTPLIATSADGATWIRNTTWTNPFGEFALADVAAAGGAITAVGRNGVIVASANGGVDWAEQPTPPLTGTFVAELKGVAAAGGTRVALGRDGAFHGFVIVSTNGTDWTEAVSGLTTFYPYGVGASGSLFVAVGASHAGVGATPVVETSTDGAVWTAQTLPASIATSELKLTDVSWDGSRFLAVGDDGATASAHLLVTSPDGIAWTVETAPEETVGGLNALDGVAATSSVDVIAGDSLWTRP